MVGCRALGVAVLDNQVIVRDGIGAAIARSGGRLEACGSFASLAEIDLSTPGPDVLVLDLLLGRDEDPVLDHIPALVAWAGVVVLHTSSEKPVLLRRAIALGVRGVVLKNDEPGDLVEILTRAAAGEFICTSLVADALINDLSLVPHLTEREIEVLGNLRDGLTQRQVGSRMRISEETVRTNLKKIQAKYAAIGRDVTNSASLVREADGDGFI